MARPFEIQPLNWQIDGAAARLDTPHGELRVAVDHPERGCDFLPNFPSLQIHLPLSDTATSEVSDCYARGNDLVATYAEDPSRSVRSQVYWRAWRDDEAVALELILSVQTSLLDSHPETSVICRQTDVEQDGRREVLRSISPSGPFATVGGPEEYSDSGETPFFLFRSGDMSQASMIHPGDFAGAELNFAGDETTLTWRLFPDSLEKGVIRRGRIMTAWMPRSDDLRLAERIWSHALSEAPLTT